MYSEIVSVGAALVAKGKMTRGQTRLARIGITAVVVIVILVGPSLS